MNKPNIDIPSGFAKNGKKEDFPNDKILNGFDPINPDVLPGDCLNKFIDDTYKGLNGVLELYKGAVLYDSTVTYTNKSLVFDITNDGIKFYHSLQNGNINNPLTDTDYWEEVNLGGSSRNVGEIISSTLPLTDAGLHLLDGSLLQYGIYKEFIDYIADLYTENPSANYFCTENEWQTSVNTYGSCGKFVYDSTNKTVRLPKVSDILQGTTDISALGDLVEAGLPNIKGYVYASDVWGGAGAFLTTGGQGYDPASTRRNYTNIQFDASRSSSIYGKSTTVQPQAIKVYYYITIATSTKSPVEVDINQIMTDLASKADTDLTNTTNQGYIKMAGASMPSDKYIDLTLGASGTSYTAPANGWFILRASTSRECNIMWRNVTNDEPFQEKRVYTAVGISLIHPILKNNVFYLSYENALSNVKFRFYYAQGSESEAN